VISVGAAGQRSQTGVSWMRKTILMTWILTLGGTWLRIMILKKTRRIKVTNKILNRMRNSKHKLMTKEKETRPDVGQRLTKMFK
jgi:hypothetical protein